MQSMRKSDLRKQILDEIEALPDDYIVASDSSLFFQVTSLREFCDARNIMLYCSVKREPDTIRIAEAAFSMGKTVSFPFCLKDGLMQARIVTGLDELRPAVLGIPAPPDSAEQLEPDELELIIVPAITYDRAGYRLGYGGGYYDRYLARTGAITVGLARKRLIKDELPREPHDIAVKLLVTESGGDYLA